MRRGPDQNADGGQPLAPQPDGARDASAPRIGGNRSDADEARDALTLAALRSLPGRLRQVLQLREIEGLPMEEVAARLGLSRRAVERRWMRAIVLMTERVEKMKRKGGA